jgi:hypothetical protein
MIGVDEVLLRAFHAADDAQRTAFAEGEWDRFDAARAQADELGERVLLAQQQTREQRQ